MKLEQLRVWMLSHWPVLFPGALAFVLAFSIANWSSGGRSFLNTTAMSIAVVLLATVTRASVQMGLRWRVFARHDSIRADIAAAGGLGKRLTV